MPRVYLTTANFHTMPKRCVCCGCATTSTFREFGDHDVAKPRDRMSMEFPACEACLAHHAYDMGKLPGPAMPPPRGPDCEAHKCLADFVNWKGADHVIDFDSPRYARLFVEANEANKKKAWCDYAWVPPANRASRAPGMFSGLSLNAPPSYAPPSYAPPSYAPPSYAPPPAYYAPPMQMAASPALAPPRSSSSAFKVVMIAICGIVLGTCLLGMLAAHPAPEAPQPRFVIPTVAAPPLPPPSPRPSHREAPRHAASLPDTPAADPEAKPAPRHRHRHEAP